VETYNVTKGIALKTHKREKAVLQQKELNSIILGKPVYEWLNMLYQPRIGAPSDTLIITTVGTKAYNILVKGG
jgi:hypothetical protein